MYKISLLIAVLCCSLFAYSQNVPLYYRVKITTGQHGLEQLAKAGVAVDHGDFKKGLYFTSDFSAHELKIIKDSGLPYEIQIEDVSSYYANRNKTQTADKPYGAEGCDVCDVYQTPLNFQLGSMGGFYTYQQFLNALDSMSSKYPNLITIKQPVSTTLNTIEGRPVYFVKISDNPNAVENEPQVLYTAIHHAREPESLSQLVFYMWYLLDNYATNDYVKYLVDHTEMYFVPCVNPDGYIYNQTTNPNGGGLWRKNRRDNGDGTFGVDINRNYGEFWGYDNQGSSPDGSNETYRGTAGFSEPETKMMRDFCNNHSFKLALNAHTFSNLLIYPWGHLESVETPDSLAFRHFGKDMASCSGFIVGTGNETVGYLTNGDSDDWMYGEQGTKDKIISMTPEAGKPDDGFWPLTQRIIPIAKQTMDQNLDVAKFATPFAEVYSTDPPYMQGGSGYIHFNFKRVGLTNSNFTVSIVPITPNISFGTSRNFNSPAHLTEFHDSITYNMSTTVGLAEYFRFAIKWENTDGFSHYDTIERHLGYGDTAFFSNGNTMDQFTSSTGWGVSNTQFVSPNGSITDSPNGDYQSNSNNSIATTNTIDLTDATTAFLSFDAKWDIEKGFDDVTLEAAVDDGNYNVLCGRFSHLGNENQGSRKAIYDGKQSDWLKEYIDLKDYVGKKIKLRFTLHSDQGLEKDGFYFDDMLVMKIKGTPVGIKSIDPSKIALENVPNPCYNNTQIQYGLPHDKKDYYLRVTDQVGKNILQLKLDPQVQKVDLDVSKWSAGIYFYNIVSNQGKISGVKKIVVLR